MDVGCWMLDVGCLQEMKIPHLLKDSYQFNLALFTFYLALPKTTFQNFDQSRKT